MFDGFTNGCIRGKGHGIKGSTRFRFFSLSSLVPPADLWSCFVEYAQAAFSCKSNGQLGFRYGGIHGCAEHGNIKRDRTCKSLVLISTSRGST